MLYKPNDYVSILQKYDYDALALHGGIELLDEFQFYRSTIMTRHRRLRCVSGHSWFQFYRSTIMTPHHGTRHEGERRFQFYRSTIMTFSVALCLSFDYVSILQKYDYAESSRWRCCPQVPFQFYRSTIMPSFQATGGSGHTSFQFYRSTIMPSLAVAVVPHELRFNSTKVRLWQDIRNRCCRLLSFQFYKSAIMTKKVS